MGSKNSGPSSKDFEEDAVWAFGGTVKRDLVNGLRVIRDGMQVAALYFSGNAKGNAIEIAVCESRLTEKYPVGDVIGWLDDQKVRYPRLCNEHKYGSDWPIFGLTVREAKEFLHRCRRLRHGYLTSEEIAELERRRASNEQRATLAALRPSTRSAVIDLVAKARISTKPWYTKRDGTPAARPRSNPAYCYNWAFGEDGEPIAVCFWYTAMAIKDGNIVVEENVLSLAERLEEVTGDDEEEPENRLRARSQGERAKELDSKLYRAWDKKLPIRVILVDGQRRPAESLGRDSSTVTLRSLDSNSWRVESYDVKTGTVCVRRLERLEQEAPIESEAGMVELTDVVSVDPEEATEEVVEIEAARDGSWPSQSYADQYTIVEEGDTGKRVVTRSEFDRSRSVRDAVLRRSGGRCELCGAPGFVLPTGALFLETHHVIPLCEEGSDNERNIVALCPNDHREAHYGVRAGELRQSLLERLTVIYPTPDGAIQEIAEF